MGDVAETDGTIIIPSDDIEVESELLEWFTQQLQDRHHHVREISLLQETDYNNIYELDIEALMTLCWEHAQYSASQGYSLSKLDVLRAIQHEDNDRILIAEILDSPWAEPYAEQTIHTALRSLRDSGEITREGTGVYRYVGPAEMDHEEMHLDE